MVQAVTTSTGLKYRYFQAAQTKEFANDNQETKIFVASDKDIIRQYYELRNRVFRGEWKLDHEKWFKVGHDNKSQIIVFTAGGKVVGGLKVLISENGELLSEEHEGTEYIYSNLLKKQGLECGKKYAEIVDMVVDQDFRDGRVVRRLMESCIDNARSNECSYIFYVASPIYCRLYKAGAMNYGCKEVRIFTDVIWYKSNEYSYSEDHPALVVV